MKFLVILLIPFMTIQNKNSTIYNSNIQSVNGWYVVNDGVMGGLSKGTIRMTDDGNAIFSGFVTTENNGGFASVRYPFEPKDVSPFNSVNFRIKGDGKNYQFRVKESEQQDFSYIHEFKTSGEWENISISLKDFYPSYRGKKLNKPNYSGTIMEEITFLIGNKKKENFTLEIESIYLK